MDFCVYWEIGWGRIERHFLFREGVGEEVCVEVFGVADFVASAAAAAASCVAGVVEALW